MVRKERDAEIENREDKGRSVFRGLKALFNHIDKKALGISQRHSLWVVRRQLWVQVLNKNTAYSVIALETAFRQSQRLLFLNLSYGRNHF